LGLTRSFTAYLHFNKTMLVSNSGTLLATDATNTYVKITGATSATRGIIAPLSFTAALGNSACTDIVIDSFSWSPSLTVKTVNGQYCDSALCMQGGTRLINPDGKFTLSVARPD